MIAIEEPRATIQEAVAEEDALMERSSAPTLRDLREAAKDLFTTIEAEPGSTSPDHGLPQ